MSVETIEANGNQVEEPDHQTGEENGNENKVMALSVNDQEKKSSLQLAVNPIGGIRGQRPIEASHLKIVSTYSSVGSIRPVVASGMHFKGNLTVAGNRPIALSNLKISENYTVMGNRPVASNEIDDPVNLMGFID
ncbi:MAG: hypothetical protein DSM107014_06495 [Gomphosphaeria aponina SAG 52.96 = DSM 107014]|uniref:Uncharacterized protein n=1 Tax=Gomphosphaeria aponina SAG 52.96 = DSM 107014 TaxID=1521640 RepID=A0A941JRW8_9CHRO|nr:hypothetical protein [Gomphosphaeria aponina SAG 52.96 = DSM 107014]